MGKFTVRLDVVDGVIQASPVAHYATGEEHIALSSAEDSVKYAMLKESSPEYLVSDFVMDMAMRSARRAVRSGLPDCHDGHNGKPCGNCNECVSSEIEAMTRAVAGGIKIDCDLYERMKNALMSVIGNVEVHDPFEIDLDEKEARDIMDEIKDLEKMNKEYQNGTH